MILKFDVKVVVRSFLHEVLEEDEDAERGYIYAHYATLELDRVNEWHTGSINPEEAVKALGALLKELDKLNEPGHVYYATMYSSTLYGSGDSVGVLHNRNQTTPVPLHLVRSVLQQFKEEMEASLGEEEPLYLPEELTDSP